MGQIYTSEKTLSILISDDGQAHQCEVSKALQDIRFEDGQNLQCSSEQLLDFLLRETLEKDVQKHQSPDLILASYDLPFRDLKIIAELRKRDLHRETPIVVFVKESIAQTRSKFLEYGVTAVYEKPESYPELKKQIRNILATLV